MKTQSVLLAALASVPVVLAHTTFTDFYVNGVPQGDGVAMRMSPHPETAGSPISSLDSEDMACNVGGTKGVSRVQPVQDGDLLSFEIRSWADNPSKPSLDRGHYGPCAVYLKKVSSAIDDKAVGDGWFKIFDHGYDASSKRWCTDEIIDNKGLLSVNLPKGLEAGDYLARPEILALHAANAGDPQFYTGCAQIHLEGGGNLGPASTVSIPGYVKYGQPSTSFDIYNSDLSTYTVPGPAIAKLVAKAESGSTSSTTQTIGLPPTGCLVENANWCGTEVPSYSDESGCWAASENCWEQGKTCWSSAPPTGGKGCELWQTKCEGIQAQCKAGNFDGPPKKGEVLTPKKERIDVGRIMATVGGGVMDAPSSPKTETSKVETPVQATPVKDGETEGTQKVPAKETPAATSTPPKAPAQAPKPTPNDSDSYNALPVPQKEEETQAKIVASITAAPGAPKPTPGSACVPGGRCVTVTEVETVVQTVYVTMAADAVKRDVRRHARYARHV